eukprot:6187205-Prymnesium_polylepis.1
MRPRDQLSCFACTACCHTLRHVKAQAWDQLEQLLRAHIQERRNQVVLRTAAAGAAASSDPWPLAAR